jgi:hypothetical protein
MSQEDDRWSFGDELYEFRSWYPRLSSLEPKWRSAASEMLKYRKTQSPQWSDTTRQHGY